MIMILVKSGATVLYEEQIYVIEQEISLFHFW